MIFYRTAIKKVMTYLDQTVANEDERVELGLSVADLDVSRICFLSTLLPPINDTRGVNAKPAVSQLTSSVKALLKVIINADGAIVPLSNEDMTMAITSVPSLVDEQMRRRCIYTVARFIDGSDPGTALEFVDRLEFISGSYVNFGELSAEDALLYRKLYALSVCAYSKIMPSSRLALLLQTHFCLMLLLMDIELIPVLGTHLWGYVMVYTRRSVSLDFAASLGLNHTSLGHDAAGKELEIEDWIAKLRGVLAAHPDVGTAQKWIGSNADVIANNEYVQSFVIRILLTYLALVSGYFILEYHGEQSFETIVAELERQAEQKSVAQKPSASRGSDFLEFLHEHQKDFHHWMLETDTLAQLLSWLETMPDKKQAREKLRQTLHDLFPEINELKNAQAIIQLDTFLRNNGYTGESDFIYFNETAGAFSWA